MRALLVIVAIAAAIRLASAFDPALTALAVGALVLAAAAYGLVSNGRSHRRGWLAAWGLLALGLTGNVIGAVIGGTRGEVLAVSSGPALAATVAGDVVAIAGLLVLLRQRIPGRGLEALTTSALATGALAFPLFTFVLVPTLGWQPARDFAATGPALLGLVMVLLGVAAISITRQSPAAYRYLIGAFAALFAAHATGAALFLMGRLSSPVPLGAVVLWGAALWSGAMVHRSQQQALEPVPLHATRPGTMVAVLMVLGALVGPSVLAVSVITHLGTSATLLGAGAAALPVFVVGYLLHQVFARSAAEYRAQHDPLTGVCNPVLFNDRLDEALVEARRDGGGLAVMFLDLDRFKSINDSLGHAVGNELLQAVVHRLQGRLRPRDTLARMGGDEFVVLVADVASKEQGANVGERMLGAFAEPFHVGGKLLPVQTSIGIAVYPDDGDDGETLFKNADIAMYQAKASGRNTYCVFDSGMSSRAELHFALEANLRQALDRGRLTVHYQPKVETRTGTITGVEALARWEHPRLGFIPPSTFIALAEETNLIGSIGEWMLETACLQARTWQRRGIENLRVAVNVSPRQFAYQPVARVVADVLARTGLEPSALELEVTESVLIEHMEATATSLAELREMGVRCSIDDFGTGYSALTYLTDMPVDAIKIDPSFVRRIDSQAEAAPIVGAVIALAHSLGLEVVAEGVETLAQLEFLTAHGCDQIQGFLFSRPVPPEEIEELVAKPQDLLLAQTGMARGDAVQVSDPASLVLPPERLSSVLGAMGTSSGSREEPRREDLLAVLAALQPEQLQAIVEAGSKVLPARIAVGTLAGLASFTGLGAAGLLPPSTRQITGEVLQQAVGLAAEPQAPVVALSAPSASALSASLSGAAVDGAGPSANGHAAGTTGHRVSHSAPPAARPGGASSTGSDAAPQGSSPGRTGAHNGHAPAPGGSPGTSATARSGTRGHSGTGPGHTGTTGHSGTPTIGRTTTRSGAATGHTGAPGQTGTTGQSGTPGTRGQSGTRGHSGTGPGHTGTTGHSGTPGTRGQSGTRGHSGTGPGHTGTTGHSGTPGRSGTAPGHTGTTGRSGTPGTRGQSGTPGRSGTASGHTGTPGHTGTRGHSGTTTRSGAATGHTGTTGQSGTHGRSGTAPGHTGTAGQSGTTTRPGAATGHTETPGHTGTRGHSGTTTRPGAATGHTGAPGQTGTTGQSGTRGHSGTTTRPGAATGHTGAPGQTGTTGQSGTPGHTGTTGQTGTTGHSGTAPGFTGTTGQSGTAGQSGTTTRPGAATGHTGTPGHTGTRGHSGTTTRPGAATGHTGAPGQTGTTGQSGTPGRSGTAPGHTGTTGHLGTPGTRGQSGTHGRSGTAPGHTGTTGHSGTPGRSGTAPGHTGTTGQSGTHGRSGTAPGHTGTPGHSGTTTRPGAATGHTGAPGQTGTTGQSGTPGHTGTQGTNATTPTLAGAHAPRG